VEIRKIRLLGGTLTGELRQPKPSKRLLVICHGYQDSRRNPTIVAIANQLNQLGHATLTFTFSPSKGGTGVEQQVRDILCITEHFHTFKEVILIAISFGALSASIATVKSPSITGLITLNGFFGTNQLENTYRRKLMVFKALAFVHPTYRATARYIKTELQPGRITKPVLVIHAKADQTVFYVQSQEFYANLYGAKQFISLESANHGITNPADRKLTVRAIDAWLKSTVQVQR
jgi:alpha-beta hydrolase superfamily lysophospholipase